MRYYELYPGVITMYVYWAKSIVRAPGGEIQHFRATLPTELLGHDASPLGCGGAAAYDGVSVACVAANEFDATGALNIGLDATIFNHTSASSTTTISLQTTWLLVKKSN